MHPCTVCAHALTWFQDEAHCDTCGWRSPECTEVPDIRTTFHGFAWREGSSEHELIVGFARVHTRRVFGPFTVA